MVKAIPMKMLLGIFVKNPRGIIAQAAAALSRSWYHGAPKDTPVVKRVPRNPLFQPLSFKVRNGHARKVLDNFHSEQMNW